MPNPTQCRKARLSDDVRIVALSNKFCANENISKLKDAAKNYEVLRTCYKEGNC